MFKKFKILKNVLKNSACKNNQATLQLMTADDRMQFNISEISVVDSLCEIHVQKIQKVHNCIALQSANIHVLYARRMMPRF